MPAPEGCVALGTLSGRASGADSGCCEKKMGLADKQAVKKEWGSIFWEIKRARRTVAHWRETGYQYELADVGSEWSLVDPVKLRPAQMLLASRC